MVRTDVRGGPHDSPTTQARGGAANGYAVREPGFTTGSPCAHIGHADAFHVGRSIVSNVTNGTSSPTLPPLRSTRDAAPTTCAPAARATSIVSRVDSPVVTTSS